MKEIHLTIRNSK